jgi:DNA-binding SARP family transcriptional activator/DNA-binding XRE family transcriptional regulator
MGRLDLGSAALAPPTLRALIRSYRTTAGLTQHDLAAKAGLSTAAVRDLEQGRRSHPRVGSLAALSTALRLDAGQARALEIAARREHSLLSGHPAGASGRVKTLWISVLGPLTVWREGMPLPVGSPARQAILGRLAIDPGMPVQREALLDLLWGDRPPRTAAELVQAHVSRLRRALWPEDSVDGGPTIASTGGGYQLRISGETLDLSVFSELAKRASAADDADTACELYEQAFELYHGNPCLNISLLHGHPAITELRHMLAETLLEFAAVASELGRHDLVLRRLQALAADEPLNERVHARLMVALAGSGQQAEALRMYENMRLRLDHDLGLYPGAELAETHLRLLRQDIPTGAIRVATMSSQLAGTGYPIPRQLPPAARHFTGHHRELAFLTGLLDTSANTSRAIPVVAVTGMAGIGKSALAVYWAYQAAERFPDGQLFADLRGFGSSGSPACPAEVIRVFLRALGVDDWRIPADAEGQRTLYRSLLATKRVLIVLDNAEGAEQIRPLLPGAPGCFVLVTSRNRLTGLSASYGAHLMQLDCLTEGQSRKLLAVGLGEGRVRAEPHAVDDLISLCAGLPLALRNAIARAVAHPSLTLADLAAAMRPPQGRLDALETGEQLTSVRTVFSWSRAKLSGRADRMVRLLAVHPGLEWTVPSAASLTAMSRRDAYLTLTELSDWSMVTEHLPGRYSCHDLLCIYAAELVRATDTHAEQRAAVQRVLDYYLHSVARAARLLLPHRLVCVTTDRPPSVICEDFRVAAEAEDWVRAERDSMLACIGLAAEQEFAPHAWELPRIAGAFLRGTVRWQSTANSLERALVTARRIGDLSAQAMVHQHLGWLYMRLGAYGSADDQLDAALALGMAMHEPRHVALVRLLRAKMLRSQGRVKEALREAEQALRLYRSLDDCFGEFRVLIEIRWHLLKLGDRGGAEASRVQAWELRRSLAKYLTHDCPVPLAMPLTCRPAANVRLLTSCG